MSWRIICFALFLIWSILSCASSRLVDANVNREARSIETFLTKSDVLQDHFVGLRIELLKAEAPIVQWNDEKFFTPGSNTKVWTLAAALDIIGDSIPWMAIQQTDRFSFII